MALRLPVPTPPIADGAGLPWDVTVEDAVAVTAEARARHGDTFVVHSGRDHYLFTFSPAGVESFYGLAEEIASKGLADYVMLRRKLPEEIFDGRRMLPGSLFRRDDVASYLADLDQALEQTVAELGTEGSVDLFDLTRRLGHRMGLASWAGPGCAQGDTFDRLVRAFDVLDGSAHSSIPTRWQPSRRQTSEPSGQHSTTSSSLSEKPYTASILVTRKLCSAGSAKPGLPS